jgi:hypothetical protein
LPQHEHLFLIWLDIPFSFFGLLFDGYREISTKKQEMGKIGTNIKGSFNESFQLLHVL